MFCTKCGAKFEEGSQTCAQCGAAVQQQDNKAGGGITVSLPPVNLPDKGQFMRFLSFDALITPVIMKALYIIVSVIIIIGMLFSMFSGTVGMFFVGLFGGILALVFFRVVCEQMLLFFSINEKLREIRDNKKM